MRRVLIPVLLLAIAAMPIAFAGTGVCRSMPCCSPHSGVHQVSPHQPQCCATPDCDQLPAAAAEYTADRHIQKQTVAILLVPAAVVPAAISLRPPRPTWSASSPPNAPLPLLRRMAILSVLLI